MEDKIKSEAKNLGLNPSLYQLVPSWRREAVLKSDIDKARERKEKEYGTNS